MPEISFLKRLKRHAGLIPLYLIITSGCGAAVAYGVRLALRSPDVQWSRRRNEISNEDYRSKQYKFYSPNIDYSTLKCPAPKYE